KVIRGLGIGLYVVHEIVSRHGGTVEVHSKPGAGSTFTVRLPRSL
ncbi:MAG: ATP-binding protein, partial [Chloroflexota bacterium]|nr:ATP-binding protein [Chloroflexota bacterium]